MDRGRLPGHTNPSRRFSWLFDCFETESLYIHRPDSPDSHSVEQAGLDPRDPSTSIS